MDIFHYGGAKYLALVDRASGYIICRDIRDETTDTMTRVLTDVFNTYGWPVLLRTDGAPNFRQKFKAWCEEKDIMQEVSSPHNSRSNGCAESAVKKAKKIVKRTGARGVELQALMQAANLAVARDGNCPADHFWSRQVRLPGHPAVRKDIDVKEQVQIRKERQSRLLGKRFSNRTFDDNQKVRVQDPETKRWTMKGVVVGSRRGEDGSPTSYYVETEEGATVWRAARFVKARRSYVSNKMKKTVAFLLTDQSRSRDTE